MLLIDRRNRERPEMNSEMTLTYGPVFLIAFTLQQLFVFYAIYRIFFKPDDKETFRKKVLDALRNRFRRGEIDSCGYKKLERDIENLEL